MRPRAHPIRARGRRDVDPSRQVVWSLGALEASLSDDDWPERSLR